MTKKEKYLDKVREAETGMIKKSCNRKTGEYLFQIFGRAHVVFETRISLPHFREKINEAE